MPYDDLFGGEERPPEVAPNLTFNVAAAPPPPPPPRAAGGAAKPDIPVDVPGVVIGSLIASHAPDRVLRALLGVVLALSAWQLFIKASKAEAPKAKPAAAQVQPK